MYDVVIMGLGPAGATLARLLDSRLSVACIDKKSGQEDSFKKPCGGLIAPDAQKALAQLGLTLPVEVLSSPQIFSVKTMDLKSSLVREYQRFYVNVDRARFDRWLVSLIPENVQLFEQSCCTNVKKTGDFWHITFEQAGVLKTMEARYVVGADGANSLLRRVIFPKAKIRSYVAIQQWFVDKNARPFYSCIFDEDNTDCYSWSISKDNALVFGGAYPANSCRKRFEKQKDLLSKKGFCFGEPTKTEACLVLRPSNPWQLCCGRDNAFLVGEAGGFISPSSLEGISSAIKTAAVLSDILNRGEPRPNRAYFRETLSFRAKIAAKLAKCPFMYNPILRRIVLKSGISSINISTPNTQKGMFGTP